MIKKKKHWSRWPKTHKRVEHGLSTTTEYRLWRGMRQRCFNKNNKSYKDYGGKGITVCDRWHKGDEGKHPFFCFLEDMGPRPSSKHQLDRYPNEHGNYEPDNVRWATPKEQAWNKFGKSRPDLSERNRQNAGKPRRKRSKETREKIRAALLLAHKRNPSWRKNNVRD